MDKSIGTRIMERRKALGMTQEDLAHKLGYKSKSTINKIELGINDISQSKVAKFAEALDVTIPYLMGWYEGNVMEVLKGIAESKTLIDQIKNELITLDDNQLEKVLQMIRILKG